MQQLAAATAVPLQQRLDDARDDIRLAAASALEGMLMQRPLLLHRAAAVEMCKQLCICLDDRNESLGRAVASALLAASDVLSQVILQVCSAVVNCYWAAKER